MNDFLADRARISPGRPALFFEGQAWTYAELNVQVARMCAYLDKKGVGQGTRVAVLLPNLVEFVMLVHSLMRVGAVIVPLNLRLTDFEIEELLDGTDVEWLIQSDTSGLNIQTTGMNRLDVLEIIESAPDDVSSWLSRPIDLGRDWGILFTSGTSGRAKGAVLTIGNLYFSAVSSALRLGSFADDRWLLGMPLYHIGGLSIVFRCAVYGTAVVLQNGFEPENVRTFIEKYRVTMISLVPTMLRRVINKLGDARLPEFVRLVLIGGAGAREGLVEEALDKGFPVLLTYGLTEAASQVATTRTETVSNKPGSVGKPLYQTQVRIANEDEGVVSQPGDIGEIQVKGPTVMRGYLNQPPLNGWLSTGDIGFVDEDGDLFVLQRRTDLIVSGGENVYPAEVEKTLREHPDVLDVCVVGLPDEVWGQQVAALVVPRKEKPTINDLEEYIRSRLAGYKVPRRIGFVDELPCTASGKVCRPDVIALLEKQK